MRLRISTFGAGSLSAAGFLAVSGASGFFAAVPSPETTVGAELILFSNCFILSYISELSILSALFFTFEHSFISIISNSTRLLTARLMRSRQSCKAESLAMTVPMSVLSAKSLSRSNSSGIQTISLSAVSGETFISMMFLSWLVSSSQRRVRSFDIS